MCVYYCRTYYKAVRGGGELYSTCASPVVPHPSTGHAHGCLASEIVGPVRNLVL